MWRLGPGTAFLLSFAIGFIVGFAFIGVSLGWLSFLVPASLIAQLSLVVGLMVGLFTAVLGVGLFYLWRSTTLGPQIAITAVIFVVGLLTGQVEFDGVALVGLLFSFMGVRSGRR